ncbi:MAG TPA: alpha-L-fucosidase [Bacteroidales bacterium]|nr:alpha-L-fucosidase [Bacteroidales bacterium]
MKCSFCKFETVVLKVLFGYLLLIVFGCNYLKEEPKQTYIPFATLNPPDSITPEKTLYSNGWESMPVIPPKHWTKKEHKELEKNLDWFHKAKYGLFFHFLAPEEGMTIDRWNAMVDSVDVEKFADQVKETGAGYVVLTIGQDQLYSCAPNPVLEKLWELRPGSYISRRDLPSDLFDALNKRGIKMMLYLSMNNQFKLPRPESFKNETDRFENWLKVIEYYSTYYGKKCSGWWIDALDEDWTTNYRARVHESLKRGNPAAITASSSYGLSEYTHGHCESSWELQQKVRKPYFGRWEPRYKIQWHVLQYLGRDWAKRDTAHSTASMVKYAADIIKGGGVITFDVGTEIYVNNKHINTVLNIPEGQMIQLLEVKKAVQAINPSDGSGN